MKRAVRGLGCFSRSTIIITIVILGFSLPVYGNSYSLINNQPADALATTQAAKLPANFPSALRSRAIFLNPVIASSDVLVPGDVITLNLFADKMLTANIDRVGKNVNGTVTVRGSIEGYPFASAIITTTNNNSLALIQIPETGEHYRIQMNSLDGVHYLLEEDVNNLKKLEDAPSPTPPTTLQTTATMDTVATAASDPLTAVNLDVMIVYTPAARVWADSEDGGIANVIAQAVAKGQLALDNSNTIMTITLVYSGEVAYTEINDPEHSSLDLENLTYTSDGYMDEVHTLRDQYGADIVGLFADPGLLYGGIGWLLEVTSGNPTYAFSITRVQQASWTYTYIHEMGHNMGCHHSKEQLPDYQPGPGLFDYSAGWRWTGSDSGKYCSVMTYEEGTYFADGITHTRVGYFSNPSITYQDVATGDAADGDNARTIREVKDVLAAYRQAPPVPEICPDFSGDGIVNFVDFETMAAKFNESTPNAYDEPDMTGDAYIDLADITMFCLYWLTDCNPPAPPQFYIETMDNDPDWTTQGQWAFGTPLGLGGSTGYPISYPDPNSGHTGSNVYGYNLGGNYANNLSERHLTTRAIDCSGKVNVHLKFWRWLGVEQASFDHAYINVSNNGGNSWTEIWRNPAGLNESIADNSWNEMDYDISAIADNHSTVYIRWTMGRTDSSATYCGWNIDDVMLYEAE